MKNVVEVKVVSDIEVVIEVIHTVDKSYSRSVEPAGKKAFMKWVEENNDTRQWRWTGVDSEEVSNMLSKYIMTYERRV